MDTMTAGMAVGTRHTIILTLTTIPTSGHITVITTTMRTTDITMAAVITAATTTMPPTEAIATTWAVVSAIVQAAANAVQSPVPT